jgi:arsenate reductase-like glutaredoxin family protein
MEILENKKIEIIEQIAEDGLKKLKFSKLLKLITFEIEELMNYWTIKQVHQIVNEVFNLNISAPLFYRFCGRYSKKAEKSKVEKNQITYKGVSQKRDIKKESILDDDELNAIAMFSSSSKNQVKD